MCGLCGVVHLDGEPVLPNQVAAMVGALRHRGPDDMGVHVEGGVGLGHARLSVLDLSSGGHQPMADEHQRATIVYNGEVYNFRELRRELELAGHPFRSRSDTEVVLRSYLQWGVGAFKKFSGMFAVGIWDQPKRRLVLARDRFGIKPLYYRNEGNRLYFASEIKSILRADVGAPGLDWQGIHEFLYYMAPLGRNTGFDGIQKLLPGHVLTFDETGCGVAEYADVWDVDAVSADTPAIATRVRELLEEAVRSHLVSDVPVAVFLSGGVDSSAITAMAARHYGRQLQTFSVGFDFEKGVNELPKAKAVAERFGTRHEELRLSGTDMPRVIEELVRAHDEPFADAANIPLFLMAEAVKGSVKVVLQGDGGDEIFGGYPRYRRLRHFGTLAFCGGLVRPGSGLVARWGKLERGIRTMRAFAEADPSMVMARLLTPEAPDRAPVRVFSKEAREQLLQRNPFARYQELYHRFSTLDRVQAMLYTDTGIVLPDVFFEKVDKATMAHGIEVRVPMVDVRLASYVMGVPAAVKIRHGQLKHVLRTALRGVVPDSILDGRKTGFGVPFQHWLRHPLANYLRSVLLDDSTMELNLFDRNALERCIDEHIAGERDNGFLLYKLLNLALWSQVYLRGAGRA